MRNFKIKNSFLLSSILFLGLSLRLFGIERLEVWFDEAMGLLKGDFLNFSNMRDFSVAFFNPPLHALTINFFVKLGWSGWILRLIPVSMGAASIIMIYFIGKTLFNSKVGIISAFILSISPFHVFYSQELRAYSITTLLSLISIYSMIYILSKDKKIFFFWTVYALSTIMIIYAHNLALFLIPAQNLYFFLRYRQHRKKVKLWLIAQLIIVLAYFPWIGVLWGQINKIGVSGLDNWVPRGSLFDIVQLFKIFSVGYNLQQVLGLIALIIFLFLGFFGILMHKERLREIALLFCWLSVPIILAKLFSAVTPLFLYRGLIYTSPAYYIIVASGLEKLKKQSLFWVLIVFIIGFSSISLTNYYKNIYPYPEFPGRPGIHPRKETRIASMYIKDNFKNGDIIIHTSHATLAPFLYYHKRQLEEKLIASSYYEDKAYGVYCRIYKNSVSLFGIKPIKRNDAIKEYKRIWLVLSEWELYPSLLIKEIERWFQKNSILQESRDFMGLTTQLYKI